MTKRYLLLSEYFHPESASTGQLMTDLAVGLSERGFELTVYTSQPKYHSDEFNRLPRKSKHHGVDVRRVRVPQVSQSSVLRRLVDWVLFTVGMFLALLVRPGDDEVEIIVVSNPPFLPIAAWLISRLRGWEYTYIVYDLWPDAGVELGYFRRRGFIDRIWSRLHVAVFTDATSVVTLGTAMRERISDQYGRPDDQIEVIHNWADGDFIVPQDKSENAFSHRHDLVDSFSLIYSGNIGESHHLESLVSATSRFDCSKVKCLIIGEGLKKSRIIDLAEDLEVKGNTVKFLPYQPLDVLPDSLTSGDISVVSVEESMKGINVSSKLYTSMAAGQPILVISDPQDDEARLVERYNCGFAVQPGDADAIERVIDRWLKNPDLVIEQGNHARAAFEERFTKKHALDEYYRVLSSERQQRVNVDD